MKKQSNLNRLPIMGELWILGIWVALVLGTTATAVTVGPENSSRFDACLMEKVGEIELSKELFKAMMNCYKLVD